MGKKLLVPLMMGIVADAVGIEASFYWTWGVLIACCAVVALFIHRIPDFRT